MTRQQRRMEFWVVGSHTNCAQTVPKRPEARAVWRFSAPSGALKGVTAFCETVSPMFAAARLTAWAIEIVGVPVRRVRLGVPRLAAWAASETNWLETLTNSPLRV